MTNALWFLLGVSLSYNFFLWWRNDDLNNALEAAMNEALQEQAADCAASRAKEEQNEG